MNINRNRLVPGAVVYWGDIVGNLSDQKDLVEYVSTHGGGGSATAEAVWGSISGNLSDQADLISKFGEYATEAWVQSQGYLTEHQDLSSYATQEWVSEQQYLTATALDGYATESWVESQGYLTSVPSGYATESWVESQGYITEHQDLSSYATKSWVEDKGYLTSVPDTFATEAWVSEQGYLKEVPSNYATQSWVQSFYGTRSWVSNQISSALEGYATESWVESKGYLTEHQDLSAYATQSWVTSQGYLTAVPSGYATEEFVTSTLSDYATQSWVQSQGYLTSHQDLSSYATQSWVEGQEYLTSIPDTFATKEWVSDQGYLTEHQDLSSYATQSWVSSQGYLTSVPSGYATQSWVQSFYGTRSWVSSQISSALSGYATESYVDQAIADAAFGSEGPDLQNVLQYDPDSDLADEGRDVLKQNLIDPDDIGGDQDDICPKSIVLRHSYTDSTAQTINIILDDAGFVKETITGSVEPETTNEIVYWMPDDWSIWPVEFNNQNQLTRMLDGNTDAVLKALNNEEADESGVYTTNLETIALGWTVDPTNSSADVVAVHDGQMGIIHYTDDGEGGFNEDFHPFLTDEDVSGGGGEGDGTYVEYVISEDPQTAFDEGYIDAGAVNQALGGILIGAEDGSGGFNGVLIDLSGLYKYSEDDQGNQIMDPYVTAQDMVEELANNYGLDISALESETDGDYVLTATVDNGSVSFSWVPAAS